MAAAAGGAAAGAANVSGVAAARAAATAVAGAAATEEEAGEGAERNSSREVDEGGGGDSGNIGNGDEYRDYTDDDARPSDLEVSEYAEYLGLVPGVDGELLWVAEQALLAPVPEGWRITEDHLRRAFYINANTGGALGSIPLHRG
jgi:hypothetical protein